MVALSGADSVAMRYRAPSALRVGDVFSQARRKFVAHWTAYCGIMAIGYAPMEILNAVPYEADAHAIWVAAAVIAGALFAFFFVALAPAAVYFSVAQDMSGRRLSFGQSLSVALSRSPAILGLMLL